MSRGQSAAKATDKTPETKTEPTAAGEGSTPAIAGVLDAGSTPATKAAETTAVDVPSVARIVHYVLPEKSNRAGEHRAAIVTSNDNSLERINLSVYLDQPDDAPSDHGFSGGYRLMTQFEMRVFGAAYDADGKPGSWHWPERK